MEAMMDPAKNKILSITFNQDQSCFACGTEKGIRIYNTIPYKGTFYRKFDAGIGLVSMFYRSNILALIGGGAHPKYPLNKVMLWDDNQQKCIGELSFKSNVKSVRLRKDRIAVVLEQRTYLYQFSDLKLLDVLETGPNPLGLCAISVRDTIIVAYPDKKKGFLQIFNYNDNSGIEKKAHDSALTAIALSADGKLCATTSDRGTLIRIFSTEDGKMIQELRRGSDKAEIQCLSFDETGSWLACTSDKGTVHVFSTSLANKTVNKIPLDSSIIKEDKKVEEEVKNKTSTFKFIKGIIPYFNSEWSFAQLKVPCQKAVVAFGEPGKCELIVVTYDGKYYRTEYDKKTGKEIKKLEEKSLYTDT